MLILFLILLLFWGLSAPMHSYSRPWGYGPFSVIGLVLLVIVVLWLFGGGVDLPSVHMRRL
jgi:hypothetical protein